MLLEDCAGLLYTRTSDLVIAVGNLNLETGQSFSLICFCLQPIHTKAMKTLLLVVTSVVLYGFIVKSRTLKDPGEAGMCMPVGRGL